ncbi:receptor-like protein 12 [Gossypium australe]|uniref:Receptor-like protein 12 n=1 Tax=Gossypium australe TaxID=47621 RepID=A0A5B6WJP1_9ROSI|nr:receptor-like protein 12 [Gossypium australe]
MRLWPIVTTSRKKKRMITLSTTIYCDITLRRLVNDYVLDGEILYKRRNDQVLLRCVDEVEAKKILEEICHKCQIYGDKIHVPPSPLHVRTSPWPFSM